VIPPSLRGRLAFLTGAVIGLSVTVFALSALWLTGQTLLIEETRTLKDAARRVAEDIDRDTRELGDLGAAVQDALEEEPSSETSLTIFDAGGNLIGSTAARGGDSLRVAARTRADVHRHHERYTAASGLVVDASIPVENRRHSMAVLARTLALAGVPLLLIALLVGRRVSGRALDPLESVTRRTQLASADTGIRSIGSPVGIDEVDRLTASFNRLLTDLDEARQRERRFAADASHELRTPLTVLLGELELARSSIPPGPAADGIASAEAQARRMRDLVDALLLLRRLKDGTGRLDDDFEAVNLADVVREVCRTQLEARPDRAGDLRLILPDEIFVRGHPGLLASVMTNLVDNALKFTQPHQTVQVTLSPEAGEVRAVVSDEGAGVATEESGRLFDSFFRGRGARAGTQGFGLGLPILREVARAHGGDVTYRPSPSGGACFVLNLPAWSGSRPANS